MAVCLFFFNIVSLPQIIIRIQIHKSWNSGGREVDCRRCPVSHQCIGIEPTTHISHFIITIASLRMKHDRENMAGCLNYSLVVFCWFLLVFLFGFAHFVPPSALRCPPSHVHGELVVVLLLDGRCVGRKRLTY